MQKKFRDFKLNGEKCEANFCSSSAFNYCVKHKEWLCSSWVMIFHYDWELKISKNKGCIEASFKIISNLIQKLEKDGDDFNLERQCDGYNGFVTKIRDEYEKLDKRYAEDPFNILRSSYLNEWKKLFNDIFESQA